MKVKSCFVGYVYYLSEALNPDYDRQYFMFGEEKEFSLLFIEEMEKYIEEDLKDNGFDVVKVKIIGFEKIS